MSLKDGASRLGLTLTAAQLAAFDRYRAELIRWNQRFNLTAVADPHEIELKHFLDSISCLTVLPQLDGRPLAQWLTSSPAAVDIGSGAGFPGLAIKLVWPGLRLTLLEATGKKCRFLEHMVATLGLTEVTVVKARAEEFGRGSGRVAFDLALARAVASLPVLLEYALPLLRIGGWLIAQKGKKPRQEVAAAQGALQRLGGRLEKLYPLSVPGLEAERTLVVVRKVAETPASYPRRPGVPQKHPLE